MFKARSGNALFLILIAVALFAALSYAVTQSSRGGGSIDREKQMIAQAVSEQCSASVNYAVNKLKLIAGCDSVEISYKIDDTDAEDKSCHVFEPEGGGAVPCGAYLEADGCDIEALAIGEKCEGADLIYAGDLSGTRLYTTAADQGLFKWANASSATGAISITDGKANTDTLVGLSDAGAPYDAANACRGLGSEWYLPAENELHVLYINRTAIGGFNTSGGFPSGWYWSSTGGGFGNARHQRFGSGSRASSTKQDSLSVRCVRRG